MDPCTSIAVRRTTPLREDPLMGPDRFDTLARQVFTYERPSRRAALATLFGAILLRSDPGAVLAKKHKPKEKVTAKDTATVAAADACFPNTNCTPGKGRNTSGCDFAHSTLFTNKNVRGSNLSNSNFFGADLTGTDFRGANLSGSCFISADLQGAMLGASVNLHGAVFCNTRMPDGRIDDRGCAGETPCCHLRLQNCPDVTIQCFALDAFGPCGETIPGSFGPAGACYHFPSCCPCDHPDRAFWIDHCNQTFPACEGHCTAQDNLSTFVSCMSCGEGP
jgi:hypothetical protein